MKLPIIRLTLESLTDFERSAQKEWLVTNGLGGYTSSTILRLNTRKYHGSLVAALHPPGDRTVCLLKLDEDVIVGDRTHRFGVNEFHSSLFPQGHLLLKEFSISPFPTFQYAADNVVLKKTIGMPYRKNVVVSLYHLQNNSDAEAKLRVYPLSTCRHIHTVISHRESLAFTQEHDAHDVTLTYLNPKATVVTRSTAGEFIENPNWVEALHYREEDARGETGTDDCYQLGYYKVELNAKDEIKFAVATAASENREEAFKLIKLCGYTLASCEHLLNTQLERYSQFLDQFYNQHDKVPVNEALNWILLAADSFVVKDESEKRSVIAGYFWFEPWGRDTFISLPGLMLVTNRFEDARYVLLNFSHYCRKGLIPNLILDLSGQPLYNTVDGTLWYINSVLQYLKYTNDFKFVQDNLWGTLKAVIEHHEAGTDFDIKLSADGLVRHGSRLTWMDAFADGIAVTPREGKAVEIQALWYNALRIMALLANRFGEKQLYEKYSGMAYLTKRSFNEKFWDNERGCLFDVILESTKDRSLRPNQIMAVSLDFIMLEEEKNRAIVDVVEREFLTSRGLRTLARDDPRYKGIYTGIMSVRDQAYHNGAVWPWLLGPFITAYFRAKGHNPQTTKFITDKVIKPLFEEQIYEGGLGTVSEIYEGDPPHLPRGCIAQAWSVAEPLRAYIEDLLLIRPKFEKEVLGV